MLLPRESWQMVQLTKNESLKSFSNVAFVAVCLVLACAGLSYSSKVFEILWQEPVIFEKSALLKNSWEADISHLKKGDYYLSVGRPRTACSILFGSRIIGTNKSELPGLRNSLLVGGGFAKDFNSPDKIAVSCDTQNAAALKLSHTLVIAPYIQGQLLQGVRALTELIFGPLCAFLMMLAYMLQLTSRRRSEPLSENVEHSTTLSGLPYFFFSMAAFLYALSLAHYPRLLFNENTSNCLHVITRNMLGLSFVFLFRQKSLLNKAVICCQLFLFLFAVFLSISTPETIVLHYIKLYPLFFVISGVMLVERMRHECRTFVDDIIRKLLLTWTIVQMIDYFSLKGAVGIYVAPSVVVLLSTITWYLREQERATAIRIATVAEKIAKSIETNEPVTAVLKMMMQMSRNETKFERASAYIDAYLVGASETPGKEFMRIGEYGYRKQTHQDLFINFREGRGTKMRTALSQNRTLLERASDGSWYLIIPIGKNACINLSDVDARKAYTAHENQSVINRILPSLSSLELKFGELGVRQGAALQKLRGKRGDGTWDEEIGCIFIDINDYSVLTDSYGEAFSGFITKTYIPGLIRTLSTTAAPEHVSGDEVYFVVSKDLLPKNMSVVDGTFASLQAIDKYIYVDGARICSEAGFPKVSVSIGLNVGVSTIICDEYGVRTAGKEVNDTKRLLDSCGKEGILVKDNLLIPVNLSSFYKADEVTVLRKKKNILLAKPLRRIAS